METDFWWFRPRLPRHSPPRQPHENGFVVAPPRPADLGDNREQTRILMDLTSFAKQNTEGRVPAEKEWNHKKSAPFVKIRSICGQIYALLN
jgi:hypothetical protein